MMRLVGFKKRLAKCGLYDEQMLHDIAILAGPMMAMGQYKAIPTLDGLTATPIGIGRAK